MNCKKCGNVLAPTDTSCKICGEPVVTSPNVASTGNPTGMTFMVPPSEPINVQNNQTVEQNVITPAPSAVPSGVGPTTMPSQEIPTNAPVQEQPVQNVMSMNTATNMNIQEPTPVVPNNQPLTQEVPVNASIPPVNGNQMGQQIIPPQMNVEANNTIQTPQQGMPSGEPTEPVKKKDSPILVAILLILLIAIIAFIVIYLTKPFDKNKKTDDNTTNQEVVDNNNTENTTYPAWMNYLQEQNITNITLERTSLDAEKKIASLNNDNLNTIFAKLANYKLIKRYHEGAGVADGDILTIEYTKGDDNYDVKMVNGIIFADSESLKDEELRDIFEKSEHTTENEELKDREGTFYNYELDNYESTILDEFFVTEKIEENQ